MGSITLKLAAGTLASLAALGMTGGAAFAGSATVNEAVDSARERQHQAAHIVKHPQSVTYKITGRVSGTRAAAVNLAREAQRAPLEVLG